MKILGVIVFAVLLLAFVRLGIADIEENVPNPGAGMAIMIGGALLAIVLAVVSMIVMH